MSRAPLGRRVLVPVANPSSVLPLLELAAALARPDQGSVVLVTVLDASSDPDEQAQAWSALPDLGSVAADLGVEVRTCTMRAAEPAEGVLEAMADVGASLVLMGWRGESSTSNVFGVMIDRVVGRSSVPLAVVRIASHRFDRVLLPVSADHLLPGGDRGMRLATALASRLADGTRHPLTVLRTGPGSLELPGELGRLGDRIHHDPRRTDQAVRALAREGDLVVAAVAPTVSGLRAATTHLAWATPDATLLVAVDVGPSREAGLAHAISTVPSPPPRPDGVAPRAISVVVTVRAPDQDHARLRGLDLALREIGPTDHLIVWWPPGDPNPHLRVTITVTASGVDQAMAIVIRAVDAAPAFRGAEISYDIARPHHGGAGGAQHVADATLVQGPQQKLAGGGEPERYRARNRPRPSS